MRSASPNFWVRSTTPSSRERLTPPLSRIRGTTRACGPHHRHGPAASSPLAARISFFPHLLYSHAPGRSTNPRSEEHTSELQSRFDLVCRLLLEKKKKDKINTQRFV